MRPWRPTLPLPKYHQIYLVLREQLQEGRFAEGLPGELALMQQFGVARVTVRRALEQLAAEGLISREPGPRHAAGAAPRRPRAATPAAADAHASLTGLLENLVSMGLHTSVKVLDVGDRRRLRRRWPRRCSWRPATRCRRRCACARTREGPLSHITTYVPADVARQLRPARTGEEADPAAAGRIRREGRPRAPDHLGAAGRRRGGRTIWRSPSARRCWRCAA